MATEFKIVNENNVVELHIVGRIDEETNFSSIQFPDVSRYVLDLDRVTGLNSMGLRNWIVWLKKFNKLNKNILLVYRKCHADIVDQMNILQGFLPRGSIVESIYVPYYCSICNQVNTSLATRGVDYQEATVDSKEKINIPEFKSCTKCGAKAEIDVIPGKFFLFLKLRTE